MQLEALLVGLAHAEQHAAAQLHAVRRARAGRCRSARPSVWVVTIVGEEATWPSRGCGCSGGHRRRPGAGPARRSRMPALTATLMPASLAAPSARARGGGAIVRSSGPRTASTMQNSVAPSRPSPRRRPQHLVGVEERRGLHRGLEREPTGCRSGSPRGSRRSWPTGSPRPRPSGPHQARRTSWASAASAGTCARRGAAARAASSSRSRRCGARRAGRAGVGPRWVSGHRAGTVDGERLRPGSPGSPARSQASMTTGTIMGRRLVLSLTNLPAAWRTCALEVLDVDVASLCERPP